MNKATISLLIFAAFSAAGGQFLFKIGANAREQLIDFLNLYLVFGLVLYMLGTAIWIYVLSYEKLVNVYAFTALTFVIVYFGSMIFLRERMTVIEIFGVILVLLGLFFITASDA